MQSNKFRYDFDSKLMGQHQPRGWVPFLLKYNAREKFYHRCVCVQVKCEKQMWKIFFHMISHVGLSELSHTGVKSYHVVLKLLHNHLKSRQQNGPKLEILQSAINTCLIINILSLRLIWKKKKNRRNKNYVTYQKMVIFIYIPWQALILPMIGLCCVKMWK